MWRRAVFWGVGGGPGLFLERSYPVMRIMLSRVCFVINGLALSAQIATSTTQHLVVHARRARCANLPARS